MIMNKRIEMLTQKYPQLEVVAKDVDAATDKIIQCYKKGGKVLLCGNGGSAADCTHIVGELMKGFMKKRPVAEKQAKALKKANPNIDDEFLSNLQCGLPAVNLCESQALLSAFCNDVDPEYIYAQQVFGLGKKGDVFIGLSTSGNAKNVNLAANIAKALGLTVIGMTGQRDSKLSENSDICIKVPETETYKIQELHLPVYHAICDAVEAEFFDK
ncbi:MAG: SIS domain-containing protein [Clostridia bacterium]|nr:SIS domain-containing protein [Clostridia bacterium]